MKDTHEVTGDKRWWRSLGSSVWRTRTHNGTTRAKVEEKSVVPFKGGVEMRVIPEPIARLIYEEYDGDESFELLHKHGGFEIGEALAALSDIIERERRMRIHPSFGGR